MFTLAFSWYSWLNLKDRETAYLSSVTELGGKSLNEYFSAYENSLSLLRLHIVESGWPIDIKHSAELLQKFHKVHHELVSVTLSATDGKLVASSIDVIGPLPQNKGMSFALSVNKLHGNIDFTIGRPVLGAIVNEWGIPMRYAVRNDDGDLVYILSATITLASQQTFWQNIFLPKSAGMGLLRDDLYMQSRYPIPTGHNLKRTYTGPRSGVVATYMKNNNFPQRAQGEGYNSVTGFESLFSLHRLKDYPLTLFVNIPLDGVVDKWLIQIQPFYILVLLFFISSLIVAYVIYQRKYAIEEERRYKDKLIQQSEERFNLAMEGSNDGLWDWDLATDEVYYSPRWKSMLGFKDSEVEHNLDAGFNRVHPDDQKMVMENVTDYLEGKLQKFEVIMRMRHKQGGWLSILSRAFLIKSDNDNKPIRLIGTHIDITERYRSDLREKLRNKILEKLSRSVSVSKLLQEIANAMENENTNIIFNIMLVNDADKHLIQAAGINIPEKFKESYNNVEIGIGMGSCAAAAFTANRVIVEDIQVHQYWNSNKEVAIRENLAASCSDPILSPSGKVLGTVGIYHHAVCQPTQDELYLLELASSLAVIAIEQGRVNEELQQASLVYKNSHEAMSVTDEKGMIISVNPAFTALTGYTQNEVIGKNLKILKSGHHDDEFYDELYNTLNATGRWQGEIWNKRKSGEVYIEWVTITAIYKDDGSLHRHVSLSSDITEKKESEELVWRHANFDTLTCLPNRRMFRDHLEWELKRVKRSGASLALMFLDLDRFKEINDSLGHDMGDILLKETARRLSECVRKIDMVARLGGDEFTVLLSDIKDPISVERVSQNILALLAEPFKLADGVVNVSASIGITFYPKDAEKVDDLLRNADHAMYAAKGQGRNQSCYFTSIMQEQARYRAQLMNDLRGALENNQFKIYYQPITDLVTGKIYKAEALLRWLHPVRGMIAPGEFIHLTEEMGLINSIGDWVFHMVANQSAQWREKYDVDFQISINKSPVQFQQKQGGDTAWIKYLQKCNLPGEIVSVEITEGLLLDASEGVIDQLLAFRDAGIQVSLDDFGTGYSSLAYLKKFDIDYLKIDQVFVCNLKEDSDDMVLCEAIIVMAHKLGIKVIAEGVETKEQLDLLISAGSDYAQGYLFSKPVEMEEFEKKYLIQGDMNWLEPKNLDAST